MERPMSRLIYLDNNATTQVDPRVLQEMLPYFTEKYGNSSSRSHLYGWDSEEAVEKARERVAKLINADPYQIIFTSGATESNNTILKSPNKQRIVTSQIEHGSVRNTCSLMERMGKSVVDEILTMPEGIIDLNYLKTVSKYVDPQGSLISIMHVNNEIGTIQPLHEITRAAGDIEVHSDMAQSLGKVEIDIQDLNVDFASFSAHKLYGPKGVGAMFVKSPGELFPLLHGGGHEFSLRSGTLNTPAIAGFGKACEIAMEEQADDVERISNLRDLIVSELEDKLSDIKVHGGGATLAGTACMSLPCQDMPSFMAMIGEKVAISAGSACMSLTEEKSHVLSAIGVSEEEGIRSIRISIGKFNTKEDVIEAAEIISNAVKTVNSGS